jgi:hypothetical protein
VVTTTADPGTRLVQSAPTELNSAIDLAEAGDVPTGWFVQFTAMPAGFATTVYAICGS